MPTFKKNLKKSESGRGGEGVGKRERKRAKEENGGGGRKEMERKGGRKRVANYLKMEN